MNNGRDAEVPKYRRAVDAGLIAVGLALFVLLSAQGVSNVDSIEAVAGQKNIGISSIGSKPTLPFDSATQASLFTLKETFSEQNKPSKIEAKQKTAEPIPEKDNRKGQEAVKTPAATSSKSDLNLKLPRQ